MISLSAFRPYLGAMLILAILIGTGCNTKKTISETAATIEGPLAAKDYPGVFARNQVQADWMNASAKLSFDDGDMSIGGMATIKMKKDEMIWMNVRKFGFEVARAMITKDSFFILDRINKEYAAESISYIAERFKLPADLMMLQQILLGNPVYLTQGSPKVLTESSTLRWFAETDGSRNEFWYLLPDYQLNQMEIKQGAGRSVGIQLLNYQNAGANRDFSYLRKIAVQSQETGKAEIEIEFTEVELNVPTDFEFSVPARYERSSK
jgi:hypothetical protein